MSKTTKYFLLAIGSGILLSASWPVNGITLLVFVGLVPLLFLEDSIRKDDLKKKVEDIKTSFPQIISDAEPTS